MKNKLLNFTICQIFLVIGLVSILRVSCQEQKRNVTVENVTIFDRSFEKVLSRRKRFLVWRPGSNLLLTASMVKALVFTRPGGHNLILEWDIFYPLPDSWRKPQKPTPPTPKSIEMTPPTPEIIIDDFDHHHHDDHHLDHPGEIWVPPGGWDSDVIKTLSEAPAEKRFWNGQNNLRRLGANGQNLYRLPESSPVTQYRNPLLRPPSASLWQQSPRPNLFNRNVINNLNRRQFQLRPQIPPTSRKFYANNPRQSYGAKRRSLKPSETNNPTEPNLSDWEHHYAHRDRRDLYSLLETKSPFNSFVIKNCLLRTICEVQHFLHPPGYSLLQDMLRVLFTVPFKEDMDDDYSNAMRADDQDCSNVYSEKCPMSILAFLLQAKH